MQIIGLKNLYQKIRIIKTYADDYKNARIKTNNLASLQFFCYVFVVKTTSSSRFDLNLGITFKSAKP